MGKGMILYCFPALRPDHYNVRCPIVRCGATLYQSFLWTAILIALPLKNISWFPERLKTGEKPI